MNLPLHFAVAPTGRKLRRDVAGFTLTEVLFASGLMGLLMGVVLSLYIFTIKSVSGVSQRLEFNREAVTTDYIVRDIKAAQQITVGEYDGINFAPVATGAMFRGGALSLVSQVGSAPPVQSYYWVDASRNLVRTTVSPAGSKRLLQNVTNTVVFTITDANGRALSNLVDRLLVKIDINMVDPNKQDFSQSLNIHTTATKRN